jgi:hypothetical protein
MKLLASAFLMMLLSVGVVSLPEKLCAQVLYGSIVGKAVDPSGAAISGAKITITDKRTNLSRSTLTDAVGNYDLPTVLPAVYDLTTSAPGFTTLVTPDVSVTINNVTRVDLTLQLGAITETVTVGRNQSHCRLIGQKLDPK